MRIVLLRSGAVRVPDRDEVIGHRKSSRITGRSNRLETPLCAGEIGPLAGRALASPPARAAEPNQDFATIFRYSDRDRGNLLRADFAAQGEPARI